MTDDSNRKQTTAGPCDSLPGRSQPRDGQPDFKTREVDQEQLSSIEPVIQEELVCTESGRLVPPVLEHCGPDVDVLSSAPRPNLDAVPTDDEVFGGVPSNVVVNGSTLRSAIVDDSEVTRVTAPDQGLLADLERGEPMLRQPATIRREELATKTNLRVFEDLEVTSVVDPGEMQQVAKIVAAEEGALELAVDHRGEEVSQLVAPRRATITIVRRSRVDPDAPTDPLASPRPVVRAAEDFLDEDTGSSIALETTSPEIGVDFVSEDTPTAGEVLRREIASREHEAVPTERVGFDAPTSMFPDDLPAPEFHVGLLPDAIDGNIPSPNALEDELACFQSHIADCSSSRDKARLYSDIAQLYEKLDDLERAELCHRASEKEDATWRVLATRSRCRIARETGDWDGATRLSGQLAANAGKDEHDGVLLYHAGLLSSAGRKDEARTVLQGTAEFARSVAALLLRLELACANRINSQEVGQLLGLLAKAINDEKSGGAIEELWARATEACDPMAANALYENIRGRHPGSLVPALGAYRVALTGNRLRRAGECNALLAGYINAKHHSKLVAAFHWRTAVLCRQAQRDFDARNILSAATAADPDNNMLTRELGFACLAENDASGAARAFAKAADRAKLTELRDDCLRIVAAKTASATEQEQALRAIVDADPLDSASLGKLGAALSEHLEILFQDQSDTPQETLSATRDVWAISAANRFVRSGRVDEACDAIATIWQRSPQTALPAFLYVEMLARYGKTRRAVSALDQMLCSQPHGVGSESWRLYCTEFVSQAALARWGDSDWAGAAKRAWKEYTPSSRPFFAVERLFRFTSERDDDYAEIWGDIQARFPWSTRLSLVGAKTRGAVCADDFADPRTVVHRAVDANDNRGIEQVGVVFADAANVLGDGIEADLLRYRSAFLLRHSKDHVAGVIDQVSRMSDRYPNFSAATELLDSVRKTVAGPADSAALEWAGDDAMATGQGEEFAALIRHAEIHEFDRKDAARALALYHDALSLRPRHPVAQMGAARTSAALSKAAGAGEFALASVSEAEKARDHAAKADAFEELARVDQYVNHDAAAAAQAWESALRAAPSRHAILRNLQRVYARQVRWNDLYALYGYLLSDSTREQIQEPCVIALDMARIGEKLRKPSEEIQRAYEIALWANPRCRAALLWLETRARSNGFSQVLAHLERAIADYYDQEPKTQAAFLTRCGETLAELGETEQAMEVFRSAHDVAPQYKPALLAWKRVAFESRNWSEVAQVAGRSADVAKCADEAVEMNYLSAVALMDGVENQERAVWALQKVIAIDPVHAAAFDRLCDLLAEQKQIADLVVLIQRRLEVEPIQEQKVELWMRLALLNKEELKDAVQARRCLYALLELEPNHLNAVSMLADIAWERAEWSEAAEMLTLMSRLEQDSRALRTVYAKLGAIYSDKIPNDDWAIRAFQRALSYAPHDEAALVRLAELGEKTSDWKLALGACERLIKGARNANAKIRHLHRAARIYREGFNDLVRAERAYRIALDIDPTHAQALSELVEFFVSTGNIRAVRLHLGRVKQLMHKKLSANVLDGAALAVLARSLRYDVQVGEDESLSGAWCAAELATRLGAELMFRSNGSLVRPSPGRMGGIGTEAVDRLLFPPSIPYALRKMLALLSGRLTKFLGSDVRRYGVGRGQRIRKAEHLALRIAQSVGQTMNVTVPYIYVSDQHPSLMVCEPTQPASIVIGADLACANETALRFVFGRFMALNAAQLTPVAKLTSEQLGILLAVIVRNFDDGFAPISVNLDAVAGEQQRLRKLIPKGLIDEIRPLAMEVSGTKFDQQEIWQGIQDAANRAGLVACASVAMASDVLSVAYGHADLLHSAGDPQIASLMRFSVSDAYGALRTVSDL